MKDLFLCILIRKGVGISLRVIFNWEAVAFSPTVIQVFIWRTDFAMWHTNTKHSVAQFYKILACGHVLDKRDANLVSLKKIV